MIRSLVLSTVLLSTLFGDVAPPKESGDSLDDSINNFFHQLNGSESRTERGLGVQFLSGEGNDPEPILNPKSTGVDLPSFTSGCGAIDYVKGGVSAANGVEMAKSLPTIAATGTVYAFLIGVETVSPLVSSSIKQIQTWANQLNAASVNACEIATASAPGMWPRTQRADAYMCEQALAESGESSDLIDAKLKCRKKDVVEKAIGLIKSHNTNILIKDYNVAEQVLSSMNLSRENQDLLKNITGTIVVKDNKVQGYPPLYRQVISELHSGNGTLLLPDTKLSKQQILKLMKQIQGKLPKDEPLDAEEQKLLDSAPFPLGTLISLMTQYKGNGSALALERFSSLISYERILRFVEEAAQDVLHKAQGLRAAQINGYQLDQYIAQVERVLSDLASMKVESDRKIAAEHQSLDYLIRLDQAIRENERGL